MELDHLSLAIAFLLRNGLYEQGVTVPSLEVNMCRSAPAFSLGHSFPKAGVAYKPQRANIFLPEFQDQIFQTYGHSYPMYNARA